MSEFGGSGIREDMYFYIINNFDKGDSILELGAGYVSTKVLSERYKLYSIEDKKQYLNIYKSNYIYAPLTNGWYDVEVIKKGIENITYSLIIVDGPTGEGNRTGFLDNIEIFNTKSTIIIDDIHRNGELKLANQVSEKIGRQATFYDSFAVI